MKNWSVKFYLVIAALFGSVGDGFASDLSNCSASRTFQNCIKRINSNTITEHAKEYSLLIEEDRSSFMFIIHLDDGSKIGKISEFGGYEWFEKTFNDLNDPEIYVQPAYLRVSGNYLSYIHAEYEIFDINYEFTENSSGDQFLDFESKTAISDINAFISQDKSFTFAGWTGNYWFAGTFFPTNDVNDLRLLAKESLDGFCFLIDQPITQDTKNKQLNITNLSELMHEFGVGCGGAKYLM